MISFIFDFAGGYFAAKYIRNIWLLIIVAIFAGILSSILANLLIYVFARDVFTLGEILLKATAGAVLHPFLTIIVAFSFRGKFTNNAIQKTHR